MTADLIARIAELEAENERLKFNHLGMLTRQGAVIENERNTYTEQRFVIGLDINYLKQMNDKLGQAGVDSLMRQAFNLRNEDVKFKFNIKSGDEYGFVTRGNPDGFISHLTDNLTLHGLSAIMAWEPLTATDDVMEVCERVMQKVYELKAQRGIESR